MTARKRRLLASALVLLSLALITVYFRESEGGGLHDAQNVGATVLRPFEVAAERVARPFRDAYGYVSDLADAKSEAKRLRLENTRLRQQAIQNATALQDVQTLRRLVDYKGPPSYPVDYRPVTTAVVAAPPNEFDQQIVISAGKNDGVRRDDAVVTEQGLVGRVARVASRTALVTLLTDTRISVSATVLGSRTGASGVVEASQLGSETLVLDRVTKAESVVPGQTVVTAGTRVPQLRSIYPRGIPIGRVLSVDQLDTDLFKRIQVRPFVDFPSLRAVVVIVPRDRAGGRGS